MLLLEFSIEAYRFFVLSGSKMLKICFKITFFALEVTCWEWQSPELAILVIWSNPSFACCGSLGSIDCEEGKEFRSVQEFFSMDAGENSLYTSAGLWILGTLLSDTSVLLMVSPFAVTFCWISVIYNIISKQKGTSQIKLYLF